MGTWILIPTGSIEYISIMCIVRVQYIMGSYLAGPRDSGVIV